MVEFGILLNNVGSDREVHVRLTLAQREGLCHDPVGFGELSHHTPTKLCRVTSVFLPPRCTLEISSFLSTTESAQSDC